jgi:hypothetical protein
MQLLLLAVFTTSERVKAVYADYLFVPDAKQPDRAWMMIHFCLFCPYLSFPPVMSQMLLYAMM